MILWTKRILHIDTFAWNKSSYCISASLLSVHVFWLMTRLFVLVICLAAPNCIKDFLDLPNCTGQSGLTTVPYGYSGQSGLELQIVSSGNNCNVKPDWPEQTQCPMKLLYTVGCRWIETVSVSQTEHFDFLSKLQWMGKHSSF